MTNWTKGEIGTGGTVGGDGAHEAVSVRYTCTETRNFIESSWYVVDLAERHSHADDKPDTDAYPYDVENMVEFALVDEAGEPVTGDYEYLTPSMVSFKTVEEAESFRDQMIRAERGQWYD